MQNYLCEHCNAPFQTYNAFRNHLITECVMPIDCDNIYAYHTGTFGQNMYGGECSGDIYIVQTDYLSNRHFKIGRSTNIPSRMQDYRCGAVREPRLLFWFPFRDVNSADEKLKELLEPFHLKREIFEGELSKIRETIKQYQVEVDGCTIEIAPMLKNDCDDGDGQLCYKPKTKKLNKKEREKERVRAETLEQNKLIINDFCKNYIVTTSPDEKIGMQTLIDTFNRWFKMHHGGNGPLNKLEFDTVYEWFIETHPDSPEMYKNKVFYGVKFCEDL